MCVWTYARKIKYAILFRFAIWLLLVIYERTIHHTLKSLVSTLQISVPFCSVLFFISLHIFVEFSIRKIRHNNWIFMSQHTVQRHIPKQFLMVSASCCCYFPFVVVAVAVAVGVCYFYSCCHCRNCARTSHMCVRRYVYIICYGFYLAHSFVHLSDWDKWEIHMIYPYKMDEFFFCGCRWRSKYRPFVREVVVFFYVRHFIKHFWNAPPTLTTFLLHLLSRLSSYGLAWPPTSPCPPLFLFNFYGRAYVYYMYSCTLHVSFRFFYLILF